MQNIFMPKFFSMIKEGLITKEMLISDMFSGLVVGIVALPLSIAFAVASGVSPEKGIITAIVAGFLVSLLGGSRVQIAGPTGAFIVILFGIVHEYGLDGLIISTMFSGIILIAFGLLKMGALLKYFPHPLVVGFTSGIAIVIFSTQVKDALGLQIETLPGEFIDKWILYYHELGSTNYYALAITLVTILITVNSSKFIPKIPGSFIAIVLMTLLVQIFDLPVTTIESFFGEIPNAVSLTIPTIEWNNLTHYIAPAFTIALLGSIESLLSAVVSDGMISSNHRSNTELIAQGIANITTPFFGGIPATGAIARTATNVKNGGRTPVAGMIHAVTLLIIMLFFGSMAKLIPMSVLAGILIVVAYNMSEWRSFRIILHDSPFDIAVLLSTFFLTVFVDLTVAIEVGIVLSALLFMKRMADLADVEDVVNGIDSDIIEDYTDLPDEIRIYEISGPLFFGSAKQFASMIRTIGLSSKILILRMRHVPFVDSTGLHNLESLIKELQAQGVRIILSGVNKKVFNELKEHHISDVIGEDNILDHFDKAVKHAKEELLTSS